jgi:dynein assembly factor 3
MASYLPAKHKGHKDILKNNTSCMVRGFWGDILVSPYISYGAETTYEPERTWMFKTVNL